MKRILTILFLLIGFCGFSQSWVTRSGAANTVQDSRWAALYNAYMPRYSDTTAANVQKGTDTCGAIIFVYSTNTMWYRQCSPKKWVELSSGGGGGSVDNAVNVGSGAEWFKSKSGANLQFRTLLDTRGIFYTQGTNEITPTVPSFYRASISYNSMPSQELGFIFRQVNEATIDAHQDGGMLVSDGNNGDTVFWVGGWNQLDLTGTDSIMYSVNGGPWTRDTRVFPIKFGNVSFVKARFPGDYNYVADSNTVIRFKEIGDWEVMTTSPAWGPRYNHFLVRDEDGNLYLGAGLRHHNDSASRMKDMWYSTAKSGGASWTQVQTNVEWFGGESINRVVERDGYMYFIGANNRVQTQCAGCNMYGASRLVKKLRFKDYLDKTKWQTVDSTIYAQSFIATAQYRGMIIAGFGGTSVDSINGTNGSLWQWLDKDDKWHDGWTFFGIDSSGSNDAMPPRHAPDMLVYGGKLLIGFGNGCLSMQEAKDTSFNNILGVRDYFQIGALGKISPALGGQLIIFGINILASRNDFYKVYRTTTASAPFIAVDTTGVGIFSLIDGNNTFGTQKTYGKDSAYFHVDQNGTVRVSNPTYAYKNGVANEFEGRGHGVWTGRFLMDTAKTPHQTGFFISGTIGGMMSETGGDFEAIFSRVFHADPATNNQLVPISADNGAVIRLDKFGDIVFQTNMVSGVPVGVTFGTRYRMNSTGILPEADNTYDFGSVAMSFAGGYFDDTLFNAGNTYKVGATLTMVVFDTVSKAYHHQAIPTGGTPALTATQVAYGDGSNLMTSSAGLQFFASALYKGLEISTTGGGGVYFNPLGTGGRKWVLFAPDNGTTNAGGFNILDETGGAYRAIITQAGETIIGGASGTITDNGSFDFQVNGTTYTSGAVRFANFGAGTATFDASGNISSVSDIRLKNVLGNYNGGISAILKINPIEYKYNKKSGLDMQGTYIGFSAQNIQATLGDNAIGTNKDGYLSIQDRAILAALTNGEKELYNMVVTLQKEVKSLRAEIKKLKK